MVECDFHELIALNKAYSLHIVYLYIELSLKLILSNSISNRSVELKLMYTTSHASAVPKLRRPRKKQKNK